MFHLDETDPPDMLRLARMTLDRDTLWQWLKPHLPPLPPDATLHDILFTRHGVTFVLRSSRFPEVRPNAPLTWLSSVIDTAGESGWSARAC
jgi:hypothetical protein